MTIKELAHENKVIVHGTVRWHLRYTFGKDTMVEKWTYHVTNTDVQNFIPQAYFRKENVGHMTVVAKFVGIYYFNSTKLLMITYHN